MIGRASKFTLVIVLATFVLTDGANAQACQPPDIEKRVLNQVLELRSELLTFLMKAQHLPSDL